MTHPPASQAVKNALDPEQLRTIKAATDRVVEQILASDPQSLSGSGPGRMGKLPLRYSFWYRPALLNATRGLAAGDCFVWVGTYGASGVHLEPLRQLLRALT